ncbi:MAG: hypothetical protein L6R42_006499 [Xanthoria sp. 1 TBL-2021]|nr:MAG: hypothetical protein L6R42_006499 [Xanthoria sp. 1 TBL-2021]
MPGAFKEPSTVERRENPTNGTSGTCEKPTDHAKDKPMQNGVDGPVDGELHHHHHKRKSDATHPNGSSRDQQRAKRLQDSKKMKETIKLLDDSRIQGPSNYIQSLPSKGVWLEIPKASQETITLIVDHLHNASLMLDYCEDGSELHRGSPASHMIFGQAQTINTATFLFVRAMQEVAGLPNARSTAVLTEQLATLFVGQSWDLHWRARVYCVRRKTNTSLEMVDKKTGGLFALPASLMTLESTSAAHYDLDALIMMLGRYFQIRDDSINLTSQDYREQKGFCEDPDKGKISYCLVMCAQKDKGRAEQIMGMFRQQAVLRGQKALQRQTKEHILKLLEEAGAMEATRGELRELEKGAMRRLRGWRGLENPLWKMVVEMLRI